MRVLTLEDIKLNSIKLKKPIISNSSYKIAIKHKNIELVVQTPIMQLVFGITQFGFNKYIDLSIFENNPEIIKLKETIFKFNNYIKKRIQNIKLSNSNFNRNNLEYCCNIKPKIDNYCERLRLSLNYEMLCFNEQKEKINISNIKLKDNVKLLICPSHIWINKNKYGVCWEVLQMKLYKIIIPQRYLFNDEKEQLYTKYFDLINKGVPREAVKQKILLDGLDPTFIDTTLGLLNQSNFSVPPTPPPPPPLQLLGAPAPPPPPPLNISNEIVGKKASNKMALLNDIKNGNFKLTKNKKVKQNKIKIKDDISSQFKPPSLQEILNKRNSLKSIN